MKVIGATKAVYGVIPVLTSAVFLPVKAQGDGVRKALRQAIPLIEESAAVYVDKRDCFSCHHQSLPLMALSRAKLSGYEVSSESVSMQSQFTTEYFKGRKKRLLKGEGVPGGPYSAGYALVGLSEAGQPDVETQRAIISYLFKTQDKTGCWRIRTHRPPLEDSHFTATALAMRCLVEFVDVADRNESLNSAVAWLRKAKPKSTEGHTFKLLGLHWTKDTELEASAAQTLLEMQREDHGWSQLPNMKSDAYATGQALAALRAVGLLKADTIQYRLGVKWLIENQERDGSWKVKTRSKPIQKLFDSGFPHGKDQFISISATCWAVMALVD